MRVAIIGAGIGGLTAAAALRANDIDVIVYEKAHELREVGAGVVIANNGLRALDEVGLGDRVRAVGTQIRRTLWHTWQGESSPGTARVAGGEPRSPGDLPTRASWRIAACLAGRIARGDRTAGTSLPGHRRDGR